VYIYFSGLASTYDRDYATFVFRILTLLNVMTSSSLHLPAVEIVPSFFMAE
jgi:hypothetical protein